MTTISKNTPVISSIANETAPVNKTSKKYELTNQMDFVTGHILYRIRALKDFSDVKKAI